MFCKTQNAFSNAHTEEFFLKLLQKNIKFHVTGLHMEAQNITKQTMYKDKLYEVGCRKWK